MQYSGGIPCCNGFEIASDTLDASDTRDNVLARVVRRKKEKKKGKRENLLYISIPFFIFF